MLAVADTERLALFHSLVPAGPIPTAFEPFGIYPYESFVETAARPELRRIRVLVLENDFIAAEICPTLGGKLLSLWIKRDGTRVANTLCTPAVVRPVRILPRGAFVGGGIEVSFPVSHTPSLLEAVSYRASVSGDVATVAVGERELKSGMHWLVEFSLSRGERHLAQRTSFHNPGPAALPWMSWSNAGVPARPDTELHFPGGEVLVHGDEMATIADWAAGSPPAVPRRQGDIRRMTADFWRRPSVCAFGSFTPSLGAGLYHAADPAQVPGIKLWSDGVGQHERWVTQYMARADEQLLEMQARGGLIRVFVPSSLMQLLSCSTGGSSRRSERQGLAWSWRLTVARGALVPYGGTPELGGSGAARP